MIKVIVADTLPFFRTGIRSELSEHRDIDIVGEAEDLAQVLQLTEELQPDILLLDIYISASQTAELIQKIQSKGSSIHIIVLSSGKDFSFLFEAIKAGAKGLILKQDQPISIVNAIRTVAHGKMWFSAAIAERVVTSFLGDKQPTLDSLTKRESQVLQLLAQGCGNCEIAETLVITKGTVKNYVSRLYAKLDLHSRSEVVAWAWQNGIIVDAGDTIAN